MPPTKEQLQVIEALENKKFDWRTVDGISRETGLSPDQVTEALASVAGDILRSSIPSTEGKALFTTRRRFLKRASVWDRIRGAIRNRAT